MGATTIWERWDSMLPDGAINPGEMTSFNHYALGAVADWLHRTVGGLAPAAPGYRHLDIRPLPGGGITSARAGHRTPYGMAECAWEIADGQMAVTVVVPPNTTASVTLPGSDAQPIEVGAGTHRWSTPYQELRVVRPPLSLDSTLGDIMDDPKAWTTVRSMLAERMPDLADQLGTGTGISGRSDLTLRQVLAMRPNTDTVQADIEAALVNLGR
jgi:alpha-L-rhamnosidase